ncbi:hypothetical protein GCM10017673_13410 [Streptosporangium violaceochromogenes]|nr:hypothetical protein GCM10017673_13410 [Streptosporangium violaceochromogenes]
MRPRSGLAPVMASGAASVLKLLVATLAFSGVYTGVEVSHGDAVRTRPGPAAAAPVRTVVLTHYTSVTPARAPAVSPHAAASPHAERASPSRAE